MLDQPCSTGMAILVEFYSRRPLIFTLLPRCIVCDIIGWTPTWECFLFLFVVILGLSVVS